MTTTERAEKIWDDLENRRMGVKIKGIWVARLTQELDQAVADAFLRGVAKGCEENKDVDELNGYNKGLDSGFELGYAAAREQAVGIARKGIAEQMTGRPSQIIHDIEAMTPGGK